MLITLIDVVSCENPKCREFAKIVSDTYGLRSHYCSVCGSVSAPRAVDAALARDPQQYEVYIRSKITSAR